MGLPLSPRHGVNPSLGLCFFCQKPKEVLLLGRLPNDEQAPHQITADMEPCQECADLMQQGVLLISVDPALTEDQRNPWRSGGWCVVRDKAVDRWRTLLPPALVDSMLAKRVAFIEDELWDLIGIPRAPSNEQDQDTNPDGTPGEEGSPVE